VEPDDLRDESTPNDSGVSDQAHPRTQPEMGFEAPLRRVTDRHRRLGMWLGVILVLLAVLIWKPWVSDGMSNSALVQFAGLPAAGSSSPPSMAGTPSSAAPSAPAASALDRLADPPITEGVLAVQQTWMFDLDAERLLDPYANNGDPSDIWFEAITDSERFLSPLRAAEIAMTDVTVSGYRDCLETLARPSESNIRSFGSTAKSIPPGSIALDVEGDGGVTPETRFCVRTNAGGISLFWFDSPLDTLPRTVIIRYRTWAANDFHQRTLQP
jgi:hypothetical protein